MSRASSASNFKWDERKESDKYLPTSTCTQNLHAPHCMFLWPTHQVRSEEPGCRPRPFVVQETLRVRAYPSKAWMLKNWSMPSFSHAYIFVMPFLQFEKTNWFQLGQISAARTLTEKFTPALAPLYWLPVALAPSYRSHRLCGVCSTGSSHCCRTVKCCPW